MSKIYKIFSNTDLIQDISPQDILFVYEVESLQEDYFPMKINFKMPSVGGESYYRPKFYGFPLYMMLPKNRYVLDDLLYHILKRLSFILKENSSLMSDKLKNFVENVI